MDLSSINFHSIKDNMMQEIKEVDFGQHRQIVQNEFQIESAPTKKALHKAEPFFDFRNELDYSTVIFLVAPGASITNGIAM